MPHFTVYPRWRGELFFWRSLAALISGLSPLARGTLAFACAAVERVRFIPAGAGNS
ncbi:hypothetical protein D088_940108 [Salmonella enterica subsp. houtenae serovar 16:z4,z32:-- str. RKS3027]|nr:hypothetical protein D088_940108 [Salmonella enterica subsp. houtenae serovar 16:z4,z32:-- str. RKS3027]